FDPFTTSPNSFAGTTETSRRDFITGIYTRADSTSPEQAGVEVLLNRDEFTRSWTADTLNWDVRTNGLKAFKWWDFGPLALKTDASFMYHRRVSGSTISKSNWSLSSATTRLEYKPGTNRLVYAEALGTYRSDDGAGYDLAFGFQEKRSRLHLQGSGSLFSRIATIQEMYWASGSLTGNSNLDNETGFSLQGSMTYRVGSSTTVGLEGRYRYSDNQAFITPDSTFINGSGFGTSTTTAFVQFNSKRWELETSLVYGASQFPDSLTQTDALNIPGDRLWIRNSVFVKGYVFKRATYIKTGIRTLISPLSYSTRWYDTNTHYWQANSTQQPIPSFIRVDAELSARIRSIMIVTRWENILDGVGQAGYFETATFPMMPRRFIVGIRARFIN
ncbi:MAG: putative porin, partial [Bacteroidota bacterium]